ncbi:hypothetical protein [Paracoccus everestensis]|uniref:hypothetical protein n=1 Tax=Paracoccus everestensis TaxID=2903900 RepID=UPI001F44392B|nr:hypothetical protein [Paracoccus everestensis]
MAQRRRCLNARLVALTAMVCLVAAQADAQRIEGNLPTAQEIWRHLPGRTIETAPAPAPEPAPESRPASRVERPSVDRPRAAVAEAEPSRTLAQARVVIHYPERGGFERAEEIVRLLRALGTAEVETRPVRYAVERQSIRYFHAADREASAQISLALSGGGGETPSDFTFFRPSPRRGTIEIWLP